MSYDSDNVDDSIIVGVKLYCDLYEKSEFDVTEVISILISAVSAFHVNNIPPEQYELAIEMVIRSLKKTISIMLASLQEKNKISDKDVKKLASSLTRCRK